MQGFERLSDVSKYIEPSFFYDTPKISEVEIIELGHKLGGKNFARAWSRYQRTVEKAENTLASLANDVDSQKKEYEFLVDKAKKTNPGSPPSDLFVNTKDVHSINEYNKKVARHNDRVDQYRGLLNQANRAKERYEDIINRYEDKKADLDEQIEENKLMLREGIDDDIVVLLESLHDLAKSVEEYEDIFAAFFVYVHLSKMGNSLAEIVEETRKAKNARDVIRDAQKDISRLLENYTDKIMLGVKETLSFTNEHLEKNATSLTKAKDKTAVIPLEEIARFQSKINDLVSCQLKSNFSISGIVDPEEIEKMHAAALLEREKGEDLLRQFSTLQENIKPTLQIVNSTLDFCDSCAKEAVETKKKFIDPHLPQLKTIWAIFDENYRDDNFGNSAKTIGKALAELEQESRTDMQNLNSILFDKEAYTKDLRLLVNDQTLFGFSGSDDKLLQASEETQRTLTELNRTIKTLAEGPAQRAKEAESSLKRSSILACLPVPVINLIGLIFLYAKLKKYKAGIQGTTKHFIEIRFRLSKIMSKGAYLAIAAGIIFTILPSALQSISPNLANDSVVKGATLHINNFVTSPNPLTITIWIFACTCLLSGFVLLTKAKALKK